jgi:indole-3-glycerol phosphate synthase
VLCDGPFFGGDYADLLAARRGSTLPLLCKEFIIDECQLDAARAHGASAALLIVRCLSAADLHRLVAAATARELVPIVEVIDSSESQLALEAGATIIGVNARDLDTLSMDGSRAAQVLGALPAGVVACHFSGIKSPADIGELRKGPAAAALVGESLMRQDDPLPLLQGFVRAARAELS